MSEEVQRKQFDGSKKKRGRPKLLDKGRQILNQVFEMLPWVKSFRNEESQHGFCDPYFHHWKHWNVCTPLARTKLTPEQRCSNSKFKNCKFRMLVEEMKKEKYPQYFEATKDQWKRSTKRGGNIDDELTNLEELK